MTDQPQETITFYDPISGRFITLPILPEGLEQQTIAPISYEQPSKETDYIALIGAITAFVIALTGLWQLIRRRRNGNKRL